MIASCSQGRTLLVVRNCCARLLQEPNCLSSDAGRDNALGDDVVAAGTLTLHLLRGVPESDLLSLTIQGRGHFFLRCTASTHFVAESGRLVFEYPPGSGMMCAMMAAQRPMRELVALLFEHGCKVRWTANERATWAARGVEKTGSVVASAIKAAAAFAGGSVRATGQAAKESGLLQREQVQLPQGAQGAAAGARSLTRAAAGLAGKALDGVASTIGVAAATARGSIPELEEQWMVDTKVVGASSMKAGGQVWQAFQDASAQFWKDFADTSSDVIGHKYGSEAEQVARDSMHAVGNALEVKTAISKKVVGVIAAKSSVPVADALTQNEQVVFGNEAVLVKHSIEDDASPSTSEVARVVVRSVLIHVAEAQR